MLRSQKALMHLDPEGHIGALVERRCGTDRHQDCIQPMFSIQIGSVPVMSRPRSGGRGKRASG